MKFNLLIFCLIFIILSHYTIIFAQKTELIIQAGHTSSVNSVCFSSDGKYIVTGSEDNTAKLWEVATGYEIRTMKGHSSEVESVSFSPDGKYIVTGSNDSTAKLWEVTTGTEIRTLRGHSSSVVSVSFSLDGKYIVTGSRDSTAKLWEVTTGNEIITLRGHSSNVVSVGFSPDSKYIVTASRNIIKIWDIVKYNEIYTFKGYPNFYKFVVSYSPDGQYVVTLGKHDTVKILEIATGHEVRTFGFGGRFNLFNVASFSPDGQYVVTGSLNGAVKLWDVKTGREIPQAMGYDQAVNSVSFSPDGKYIITGSEGYNAILWETKTGKFVRSFTGNSISVSSVSFSPNKKYIASGGGFANYDGKLWNIETSTEICALQGHNSNITSVSFSPDSRYLITGSNDCTAKLWDVVTGNEIRTFKAYSPGAFCEVESVCFSPDGEYIVTDVAFGATLWHVATGREIHTFRASPNEINPVAFSAKGKYVATGGSNNTVKLWDVATGREVGTFRGHSSYVISVSFSPDGKYIITGSADNTAKLWEVTTGNNIYTFSSHSWFVTSVSFSPDGKTVVTGSGDKTAKLWDVITGTEIHTFRGHTDVICSVNLSTDGKYLLTGSWDKTMKVWDVNSGEELATLISLDINDWAVTTPGGVFDASEGAEKYIHFVRGLEVIELNQLKERYYEPGLLAKIMGFNDEPIREVIPLSETELYPEIKLTEPKPDHPKLEIHLKNRGGGIGTVVVFINDKEITADARKPNTNPDADDMELAVNIGDRPYLIPGEDNIIEVKAFNADGYLSSRNVRAIYKAPAKVKVEPPTLWGIVAGVSEYHGDEIDLRFAAKDAVDMAQALNIGAHRLFGAERTYVTLLTTEKTEGALYPDKDNLFQAFSDVAAKAKSTDILVVYLAGHGVTYGGQEGDYYYLTAEASSGDLKDEAIRQQRAVSSQELTEQIKNIPALKQVLILDTCHSGRFSEDMTKDRAISSSQIRAYERMKDRTGLHILAGAAADAVAYESSSYGQGILTYSLLLGMRGAALRDDEYIDISRLFQYSADQVPELAKDIGGIQRPIVAVPYGGTSFDIGRLGSEDKPRIPIAQVRPLVLRCVFQNEAPPFKDNLDLGKLLNDEFRKISNRGREASLIFIDADEFPLANQLSGRYNVKGNSVAVTVYITQGDETKANFLVQGNIENVEQLAVDILKETEWNVPK